jgi:hypothetical protein
MSNPFYRFIFRGKKTKSAVVRGEFAFKEKKRLSARGADRARPEHHLLRTRKGNQHSSPAGHWLYVTPLSANTHAAPITTMTAK